MTDIWVLGSKHQNSNKSVDWNLPFPNFVNSDVLIINLQTLLPHISQYNEEFSHALYYEARRYIFDMLMTGAKQVIVILPSETVPQSVAWLPIRPTLKGIATAKIGEILTEPTFIKYLANVQTCSYYIQEFDPGYIENLTRPSSKEAEEYTFSRFNYYNLTIVRKDVLLNVAKQVIGGTFAASIKYGHLTDSTLLNAQTFFSGKITFLPPPTKKSVEFGIDDIISEIRGESKSEPIPPDWDKDIAVPMLPQLEERLKEKEKELSILNNGINDIQSAILAKKRLRRLLWSEGINSLEEIVKEAFIILGFNEIRKIRAPNLEDWVFDFKHIDKFKHAILEVKASEKRTSLADLTQCNKWVEDYMLEDKAVKGIFLPNQYRLEKPSQNSSKRLDFAPNEKEYARTREICILPTCVLFELVKEKLKDPQKVKREEIEKKIADTNGLWKID